MRFSALCFASFPLLLFTLSLSLSLSLSLHPHYTSTQVKAGIVEKYFGDVISVTLKGTCIARMHSIVTTRVLLLFLLFSLLHLLFLLLLLLALLVPSPFSFLHSAGSILLLIPFTPPTFFGFRTLCICARMLMFCLNTQTDLYE